MAVSSLQRQPHVECIAVIQSRHRYSMGHHGSVQTTKAWLKLLDDPKLSKGSPVIGVTQKSRNTSTSRLISRLWTSSTRISETLFRAGQWSSICIMHFHTMRISVLLFSFSLFTRWSSWMPLASDSGPQPPLRNQVGRSWVSSVYW